MWIVELLIVLFFIWLGARLGSIGIGFAGGLGVLVLGFSASSRAPYRWTSSSSSWG